MGAGDGNYRGDIGCDAMGDMGMLEVMLTMGCGGKDGDKEGRLMEVRRRDDSDMLLRMAGDGRKRQRPGVQVRGRRRGGRG